MIKKRITFMALAVMLVGLIPLVGAETAWAPPFKISGGDSSLNHYPGPDGDPPMTRASAELSAYAPGRHPLPVPSGSDNGIASITGDFFTFGPDQAADHPEKSDTVLLAGLLFNADGYLLFGGSKPFPHSPVGAGSGSLTIKLHERSAQSVPIPEPATLLLFGAGLAGLVGLVRRRSQ